MSNEGCWAYTSSPALAPHPLTHCVVSGKLGVFLPHFLSASLVILSHIYIRVSSDGLAEQINIHSGCNYFTFCHCQLLLRCIFTPHSSASLVILSHIYICVSSDGLAEQINTHSGCNCFDFCHCQLLLRCIFTPHSSALVHVLS